MNKTWLEAALEEVQGRVKLYESKLEILQMESETKVLQFICEHCASKQKQKILIADFEKVQKMLENVKANEEKLDNTLIRLELRLKSIRIRETEASRRSVLPRGSIAKLGSFLRDEVFALRRSFCAEKTKRQKLEPSFSTLSGDYEELKAKRVSNIQRISDMEKAMSELDDCKHSKAVLEKKIMQMEWDLAAREALRSQISEQKTELGKIKSVNSEFQRRIRYLEGEKSESLRKVQALEEEFRKKIETKRDDNELSKIATSLLPDPAPDIAKEDDEKAQAKQLSGDQTKQETFQYQRQIDNKRDCETASSSVKGIDPWSKNFLETKLAEFLD